MLTRKTIKFVGFVGNEIYHYNVIVRHVNLFWRIAIVIPFAPILNDNIGFAKALDGTNIADFSSIIKVIVPYK
jgi:hypothetical protein